MQTTLNLLTRDGAVYMAFRPSLSADQYADLLQLSEIAVTADGLRESVAQWAKTEGLDFSFSEFDAGWESDGIA